MPAIASVSELSPEAIVHTVAESGLRGRGGAGFPAGIKWRTAAETDADQKYIACNADEGEPGTFKDRVILEDLPYLVIEGMMLAGLVVGASRGIVYLRHEYVTARAALLEEIEPEDELEEETKQDEELSTFEEKEREAAPVGAV